MAVEKRRELRPVYRRRCGWFGDPGELWSQDVESVSPKARAVTGMVTGGAILLAAAFLVLFTDLWWLIFIFGWMAFPALGTFAKGIAGLMESRQEGRRPQDSKEQELLEALRDRGELTHAQAAVETSLTVKEADEMLKELAEGGHLEVRVRDGALSYSLWGHEKDEERGGKRSASGRPRALMHSIDEKGIRKMSDPSLEESAKATADLFRAVDPVLVRSTFQLTDFLLEEGGPASPGRVLAGPALLGGMDGGASL